MPVISGQGAPAASGNGAPRPVPVHGAVARKP
jgi:hypothetical protein